jgi:Ca-activated chloride channel family protein
LENFRRIELGMIDGTSTAIGSAIASSVGRLRNSDAKSKVIILLTDGTNNAGKISPPKAAEIAKAFGIKIYTIGAGTKGLAPVPQGINARGQTVYINQKVDIDEETLKEIADITGGKYFRATDTESLLNIYKEIDGLEKIKIEELGFKEYKELFAYFLGAAILLLCLETILAKTIFFKVP